ncbi:MAG: hypothetical protein GQE15_36810 [Archangiaceae bacterium]|nr:hypothetical protein [Archangiaceae bacterium]
MAEARGAGVNMLVLRIFAPVLIVVGVLGFVLPESMAMTSGAAPYNVFHIIFGLVGLGCVASKQLTFVRAFTIGFGAIDLYQAVASFAGLWPKELFQWKTADDVLHIVIGLLLVGVGVLADRALATPQKA